MPALLTRTSRASTASAAARMSAALVTSRVSGRTRGSECAHGSRVPAYTRRAPRRRASSTSARPMPRVLPVMRTALLAIDVMTISFIVFLLSVFVLLLSVSGQRGEARRGEQIGVPVVARVGREVEDGLPDLLRGQGGPGLGQVGGDVLAVPGRVGRDRGRAEVGGRRQLRQQRDEPDAEAFPHGLGGGVAGEEPDGGLGAGVAAAERRAVHRGAA